MVRVMMAGCVWMMLTAMAMAQAPYADSATIKKQFDSITAEDMAMLRSKKILFASRSFGLNLNNGLRALAREDGKYEMLSSYQRYDVFKAGGDLSIIPGDAFKEKNFVHFLATYWPHTKRVDEVDQLMRQEPHEFGKQIDAVVIFYHTANPGDFEHYATKMDALRRDYPKVKVIYVTAGFMADTRAEANERAHAFSEQVRKRYQGKQPLYDLGRILSDDFRVGHAYVPEYSKDPAGVHPNLDAGQTMMAKGFLLVLRDAFRQPAGEGAAATEGGDDAAVAADPNVETLPENHRDYQAVRGILNANGLTEKTVESVAVVKDGRVVGLYLQEGGITKIPPAIGILTELRTLHVYGDRDLDHPLLTEIDSAIGRCVKLEDVLLNHNELTTLPATITRLTQIKSLSIADNRMTDLPEAVKRWVEQHDAEGLKQQSPAPTR